MASYFSFHTMPVQRLSFGHAHYANRLEMTSAGFFTQAPDLSLWVKNIMHRSTPMALSLYLYLRLLVLANHAFAIPNLFHFTYSCVVKKVKLTLFNTTSNYREQMLKNRCYCWVLSNKSELNSSCWHCTG